MENPGKSKLFVFVGKKISVNFMKSEGMDGAYKARYKIEEVVCGDYQKDTIEFIAYDHYGDPGFSEYDHVLLYVSLYDDTFYHQKYIFDPVFKTKSGRWAGYYRGDIDSNLKPVPIEFAEELSFDISSLKYKRRTLKSTYPEPYFQIVGSKAIARQGYYVPELFELQKRGVLTARGLFGKSDPEIVTPDVELEDIPAEPSYSFSKRDSMALIRTWRSFFKAIEEKDTQKIRAMSLDSVICSICEGLTEDYYENNMESIDGFIAGCNRNLPDTALYVKMKRNDYKISVDSYLNKQPVGLQIYEVRFSIIVNVGNSRRGYTHTFQFVKIDNQFRFSGVHSY
jgi:hypothetical protein